jgi:hypothetical protein
VPEEIREEQKVENKKIEMRACSLMVDVKLLIIDHLIVEQLTNRNIPHH